MSVGDTIRLSYPVGVLAARVAELNR